MRVLASTTAGAGHFQPMVPLLRGCAAAGHEVLVAAPASFGEQVRAAGFDFAPFDDVPPEQFGPVFGRLRGLSYDEGNRIVMSEVFAGLDARAALPRLAATFERWHPDLVLRDATEYASWVLAEREAVAHARVAIGLLGIDARFAPAAAEGLAPLVHEHGLAPDPEGRRLMGEPVIASAPASFDPPDGLDATPVHRFAPPAVAASVVPVEVPSGDEPLVYVTFGTVASALGLWPAAYRLVIDALANEPVRVLVTTGSGVDLAELGPVPANTAVAPFVPQEAVLPHTAVMVTHGGYGTVLGALRAGVPMAVMPLFADHSYNADRVAEVGAGLRIPGLEQPMSLRPESGDAVRAAVLRLLADEEASAAAGRLAREMAAHPPLESVVASAVRQAVRCVVR